jgi:ubiquinone/menaquinone biosynthesis C-methylase UbiE
MEKDWKKYHNQTKERSHSKILAEALEHVVARESALDVGAGTLSDSKFLLSEGFERVVALDIEPFEALPDPRFEFIKSSFEEYEFPLETFDVINARFSFPFCNPQAFPRVWKRVTASLKKGGVFSGQLFGVKDEWATDVSMTFQTQDQLQKLLSDFDIIRNVEVERNSPTAEGHMKHWHFYALILRKH